MLHESQVWIGFNDKNDEGNWTWSSNEPAYYLNWAPNQPDDWFNGLEREDCVTLSIDPDYYWNDLGCRTREAFVCELSHLLY